MAFKSRRRNRSGREVPLPKGTAKPKPMPKADEGSWRGRGCGAEERLEAQVAAKHDAMNVDDPLSKHGEEFDNWWQFFILSIQSARNTIMACLQDSQKPSMGINELPKNFESRTGSSFEK